MKTCLSRQAILTFILFFSSAWLMAQAPARNLTREEYIQQFKELAISEMARSGVPASIKMAQGILESGNGNSTLARKANNHFGIKCRNDWRGRRVFHDDDEKGECFRAYNSARDSYIDHSNFLTGSPRYAELFTLDITDYKGWAHGLRRAGYATNPRYAELLIRIIEENQLFMLDTGVDGSAVARIDKRRMHNQDHSGSLINPYATRKVDLRNGLRSIVVRPGDTFESLSAEFGMKEWELYYYNDYQRGQQPRPNEILYIEHKQRKADKRHQTHVAEDGDTMHYIAQRYGLRMNPLLRRNRMDSNEQPAAGDTVYLRKRKPRN